MKLSSISCTVITLAALTCSVTAIPTHYSPSHHDEQPQGTGAYRRDLEDDNLFARGPQYPHDHHQTQSHNHQSQSHQTLSHGGGSFQRRDLEDDNLFARATHHTGASGQGYNNPDAGLRRRDLVEDRRLFARSTHLTAAHTEPLDRRDLEDDEDLFARHEHHGHGQEHNDPSGPILERRRLVARSTQYNNYD